MPQMPISLLSTALTALLPTVLARAETIEDLKGLSIDVHWKETYRMHHPPEQIWTTSTQNHDLRVYISSKSNIFAYETLTNPNGKEFNFLRVTPLDRASETGRGLMRTWTMTDGHLSMIQQALEGFRVLTVAVDPSRTTCTFNVRDEPDPKTGRFWNYRAVDGTPAEFASRAVMFYTCTVKRGNIFGPEE
jgi:hypothetical protein